MTHSSIWDFFLPTAGSLIGILMISFGATSGVQIWRPALYRAAFPRSPPSVNISHWTNGWSSPHLSSILSHVGITRRKPNSWSAQKKAPCVSSLWAVSDQKGKMWPRKWWQDLSSFQCPQESRVIIAARWSTSSTLCTVHEREHPIAVHSELKKASPLPRRLRCCAGTTDCSRCVPWLGCPLHTLCLLSFGFVIWDNRADNHCGKIQQL